MPMILNPVDIFLAGINYQLRNQLRIQYIIQDGDPKTTYLASGGTC